MEVEFDDDSRLVATCAEEAEKLIDMKPEKEGEPDLVNYRKFIRLRGCLPYMFDTPVNVQSKKTGVALYQSKLLRSKGKWLVSKSWRKHKLFDEPGIHSQNIEGWKKFRSVSSCHRDGQLAVRHTRFLRFILPLTGKLLLEVKELNYAKVFERGSALLFVGDAGEHYEHQAFASQTIEDTKRWVLDYVLTDDLQ